MLVIYLACLVFGTVLIALSTLGGDTAHGDTHIGGGDVDVHADGAMLDSHGGDVLVHADTAGGDVAAVEAGQGANVDQHADAAEAARFFSFRNLVFFTGFFGLTGSVLTWIGIPSTATFAASVALGTFAAYVGYRTLRYLKHSESGAAVDLHELRGRTARIVLDTSRDRSGKIALTVGDRSLQLVARVADEAAESAFAAGRTVIVMRIVRGIAEVIEGDELAA